MKCLVIYYRALTVRSAIEIQTKILTHFGNDNLNLLISAENASHSIHQS